MHAFSIVGYTFDADTYCEACASHMVTEETKGDFEPIFASHEWDRPCYCGQCDELLDVTLTGEGVGAVIEILETLPPFIDLKVQLERQYREQLDERKKVRVECAGQLLRERYQCDQTQAVPVLRMMLEDHGLDFHDNESRGRVIDLVRSVLEVDGFREDLADAIRDAFMRGQAVDPYHYESDDPEAIVLLG